ncbi:hypothetical protein R3P38DRAFT_2765087 [Favolaschia claudopus]|uniref:Uncharacterized protein n=1 Tax=Favolaschia claudopus TaxID=2862362 RepID=A0AAW0D4I6_9AGAR
MMVVEEEKGPDLIGPSLPLSQNGTLSSQAQTVFPPTANCEVTKFGPERVIHLELSARGFRRVKFVDPCGCGHRHREYVYLGEGSLSDMENIMRQCLREVGEPDAQIFGMTWFQVEYTKKILYVYSALQLIGSTLTGIENELEHVGGGCAYLLWEEGQRKCQEGKPQVSDVVRASEWPCFEGVEHHTDKKQAAGESRLSIGEDENQKRRRDRNKPQKSAQDDLNEASRRRIWQEMPGNQAIYTRRVNERGTLLRRRTKGGEAVRGIERSTLDYIC